MQNSGYRPCCHHSRCGDFCTRPEPFWRPLAGRRGPPAIGAPLACAGRLVDSMVWPLGSRQRAAASGERFGAPNGGDSCSTCPATRPEPGESGARLGGSAAAALGRPRCSAARVRWERCQSPSPTTPRDAAAEVVPAVLVRGHPRPPCELLPPAHLLFPTQLAISPRGLRGTTTLAPLTTLPPGTVCPRTATIATRTRSARTRRATRTWIARSCAISAWTGRSTARRCC